MKKLVISICTLLCLMAAPLSSAEWGGLLFNDSGVSTSDFSDITIKQSDGISLWLKAPLGVGSGFYFSSEALYKFTLEIAKGSDPVLTQIADLPMLKIWGETNLGSGVFTLNAGRFYYVDSTAAVLSQTIDAVSVKFAFPSIAVGAFAGYTGLLNALNVPMNCTPTTNSEIYNLAYPYVPLGFILDFPSLFGNQGLELDAYYMVDLGENKKNLCYADLLLSGPITNTVYYNLATSFGFIDFKDMMNYSSLSFLIFPSEKVTLSAGATFGSADGQGPFKAYSSLSAASPSYAGAITPKAALTYTTATMCIDVSGNLALTYSDPIYKPNDSNWSFSFIYNIFSDLQLGFTVNAKLDVTGANQHNYDAKLNLALAF